MCEPTTIALVASTVITGAAAVQAGEAAKDEANFNAASARLQGEDVLKRGALAEDQQRSKVRQTLGTQSAIMGALGVDPSQGTAGKVLEQTATLGELDAQTIRSNAARQAWGYENQAMALTQQGAAAGRAGQLSGLSTVLAGGARAYGVYGDSQKKKFNPMGKA